VSVVREFDHTHTGSGYIQVLRTLHSKGLSPMDLGEASIDMGSVSSVRRSTCSNSTCIPTPRTIGGQRGNMPLVQIRLQAFNDALSLVSTV
jgi:hypothetical protein